MELTLNDIAAILKAAPPAAAAQRVAGYSIDSRTIRAGELFIAVRGERLDGHDFVRKALEAGAAGAVVGSERWGDFPEAVRTKLLGVPDPLAALQKLAAEVRRRWGGPVIAVTGSTGKTTTKQMIASLLATRFRVLQNEGNFNNHFGLPLSLLRLEPETEVGVFELAMSGPGEIKLLAELAAPDVGVVTNVGPVHLEFFPDVEAIARAKFELIETLDERAWAVLNADDPRVSQFGQHMPNRVLTFGIDSPAHFQARELADQGSAGFVFSLPEEPYHGMPWGVIGKREFPVPASRPNEPRETRFHLPLFGRHNVRNVLAALAAAYLLGILPCSLPAAVSELRPSPLRGELVRLASGALVVNDCYNSNPEALEAMLESVATFSARRRFAVLGGMMELGPDSERLHYQCGVRAGELGFDFLLAVGEMARPLADGARAAGLPREHGLLFGSPEEAGDYLRERLQEGDVVLLKASRAVRLEKIWERWRTLLSPAGQAI